MPLCLESGRHQILISSNSDRLLDRNIDTANPHLSHLLEQNWVGNADKSVVRGPLPNLQPSLQIRM